MGELTITEVDVFQALKALDVSKAMGCDNIIPRHCALALYQPLYHLFSLSLSQHYLPVEWRTHIIKPIFKSGVRNSIRNYKTHFSYVCCIQSFGENCLQKHC